MSILKGYQRSPTKNQHREDTKKQAENQLF